MSSFRASIAVACLAVLFAPVAFAATYIVPTDEEIIQRSDDIVVVTFVSSFVDMSAHAGIVTRYTLRIEDVLKGPRAAGQDLVVTELGGQLGEVAIEVPGRPHYIPGVKYLVFTETDAGGEPITLGMALGQFALVGTKDHLRAVRPEIHGFSGNFDPHVERVRSAAPFMKYIRSLVTEHRAPEPDYFVAADEELRGGTVETQAVFPAASYVSSTLNWRWPTPSYDFIRSGQQPGGSGDDAVATALSEWSSTASNIDLGDGGRDDTESCSICNADPNLRFDGKNVVTFNDAVNVPAGVAGQARFGGGGNHSFDGDIFTNIQEGDVILPDQSFSQCVLDSIVTHEIGHTLGFRHSNEGKSGYTCGSTAECTSAAIMNFSVGCTSGALQAYDQNAASTVYGTGPTCNPPTIPGGQPADKSVAVGTQTSLSVTPGGTGPFTFEWYFGTAPDASNLVAGATSSSLSITPSSVGSGQYWVRVGHSCSGTTVNSRTATVTATCTNAAINTQPADRNITGGQSTQLSVTATGSGLSYQWYRGTAPDTSQPVGGNSNTLNVSPQETTSYWVRVTGSCGSPVDSNTATVTVTPCAEIIVDPPTATPGAGAGQFTLNVTASSTATPLSYAWFRGGSPGFGGTSIGQSQSLSITVTSPNVYWARVQNSCGRVDYSSVLNLAPCTLPSITTQPADKTVSFNQSAALSIAVSAGATVTWYRGAVGDTSNQIGTGAAVNTPALTTTTQFWARVTNTCGSISSRQVTVTVQQITDLVTLLDDRFFVIVNYVNQFANPPQTGKLLGRSLFDTPTSETAIFTFGDPLVVELMVRVSDARPFDNKIHVYLGGLSDVEFSVIIADSLTGIVKEYKKPPNQLVGVIDRATFPATNSLGSAVDALMAQTVTRGITPQAEVSTINLLNNRFQVRMRYRNQFANPAQTGYLNARSIATSPTTETAVFFFGENVGSVEWMVRFSDARPFAERIDLFHGGLSDVEFTIEVLDTKTGAFKEYQKPPFSLNGLVDRDSYKP